MEDDRTAIYDAFEAKLRKELIKLCTEYEMMNGRLLHSDDIDAKWDEFGRDYMIDAVHEFNSYPEVALAWSAFSEWGSRVIGTRTGASMLQTRINPITAGGDSTIWTTTYSVTYSAMLSTLTRPRPSAPC